MSHMPMRLSTVRGERQANALGRLLLRYISSSNQRVEKRGGLDLMPTSNAVN